jgi:tripartite-type tricarboxylate transporter receptor subunit TctC
LSFKAQRLRLAAWANSHSSRRTHALPLRVLPHKGNPPSLNAVLSGAASVLFGAVTAALSHIKSGKLRALGVTTGGERRVWR